MQLESNTTFNNGSVFSGSGIDRVSGKGFGSGRVIGMLAAVGAVLLGVCVGLVGVRKAYDKAEKDYAANNYSTVTTQADGTIKVSGIANGEPYEYVEDGRILPGVKVAGIDLGGMNYDQAREALINDIADRVSGINICATVENRTLVLTSTDFNISCAQDVNELIYQALRVGRGEDKDYYSVYKDRQRIAEEGVDIGDYDLVMDVDSMRGIVEDISHVVDKAPVEPYITLLNRLGGGKPGVGVGGDASDIFITRTVKAPDGTTMAEIQFHEGKNGYVLDQEDMLNKIVSAFNSGSYKAELELALQETEPEHTAQELADSIEEISRFSTRFASSSDYRARNVQKAAGLLHCMIMSPGVEYSYNETLGPRYESDGWLPAPGIAGGKEYIDSPGGGICQVSSTLYNSLLKLGPEIQIVRRSHHSIPGSYIDMGLDATVSYGGPDLVWKVNGDTPMLLFSYADMSHRTVYEIIYGVPNPEGFTYRIWSETVETIDPPEPLHIEEPMWPRGYSKMVITARTGYNVNVYRQKYDADGNAAGEPEVLYMDRYAAVRGELHVGTGSPSLPIPQG